MGLICFAAHLGLPEGLLHCAATFKFVFVDCNAGGTGVLVHTPSKQHQMLIREFLEVQVGLTLNKKASITHVPYLLLATK